MADLKHRPACVGKVNKFTQPVISVEPFKFRSAVIVGSAFHCLRSFSFTTFIQAHVTEIKNEYAYVHH